MSKFTEVMKDNKITLSIYLIIILGITFAAIKTEGDVTIKINMVSAGFGIVTWQFYYFLSQEILENKLFLKFGVFGLLCIIVRLFCNVVLDIPNFDMLAHFYISIPLLYIFYYRILIFFFFKDYSIENKITIVFFSKYGNQYYDGKEIGYKPSSREKTFSILLFLGFMLLVFGVIILIISIS